jgi:hypothetical protein
VLNDYYFEKEQELDEDDRAFARMTERKLSAISTPDPSAQLRIAQYSRLFSDCYSSVKDQLPEAPAETIRYGARLIFEQIAPRVEQAVGAI